VVVTIGGGIMNNVEKTVLAVGSVAFVFLIAFSAVYAFPETFSGRLSGKTLFGINSGNFTYNDSAITTALQNNDYSTYMSALDAKWQAYKSSITQDVFNKMVQDYNNRTSQMQQRQAANAKIAQAIKDDSYTEWQQAISALPKAPSFASKINATNFDTYVQLYNAQQSKDWTTVKTLSTQLGITGAPAVFGPTGMGRGNGRMMGHHQFGNMPVPASN